MCITYSCIANFCTLENMELFNTDLLNLIEVSLENLEGKTIEAEPDRLYIKHNNEVNLCNHCCC